MIGKDMRRGPGHQPVRDTWNIMSAGGAFEHTGREEPDGLELDYERIEATRARIAEMLR